MNGDIIIRSYDETDLPGMMKVFNYFAENSSAVYTGQILEYGQFVKLAEQIRIGLVVIKDNVIIGFGFIARYKPYQNFNRTGTLTYFIMPEYTGCGIGTLLFNKLIDDGLKGGITNYLAHISSKNTQSLAFHKKHGFTEVGRFFNVADKFGESFDIVWVQKQYN